MYILEYPNMFIFLLYFQRIPGSPYFFFFFLAAGIFKINDALNFYRECLPVEICFIHKKKSATSLFFKKKYKFSDFQKFFFS